jgi:hypothetical protein
MAGFVDWKRSHPTFTPVFFFEEKYAGVPPFSLSKKEHTRVQKGYLQLTGHKKTEKMKETQRTEDTNTQGNKETETSN